MTIRLYFKIALAVAVIATPMWLIVRPFPSGGFWLISIIGNIAIAVIVAKQYWKSGDQLLKGVIFQLQPWYVSLLRGEYIEDMTHEVKWAEWFIIVVSFIFLQWLIYMGLDRFI